jgi:antitoxin VapB
VAINIKDADTDRLARELAELTGQPITVAVRIAIQDRLAALRRRETIAAAPDLRDIIARGRQRRIVDDRLESDILGYDDDGLPA